MSTDIRTIVGRECKHVTYGPSFDDTRDDLLFVKERIHYSDGTSEPSTRMIMNFKRPFYVTKESCRNHKDKKEWEDKSKLIKHTSTQRDLVRNVGRALGRGPVDTSMRILARSPYIYGTDVTAPVLVKRMYMDKYPAAKSDNVVSVFDVETSMRNVPGTNIKKNEIVVGSLTCRDQVLCVVRREFVRNIPNPEEAIRQAFVKYLGDLPVTKEWRKKNPGKEKYDLIAERNLKLTIKIVDTPGQICHEILKTAHAWKPDFFAIWNLDFDVPKMIEALENEGYNLADEFNDPSVPPRFRQFQYKQGQKVKITAEGKRQPQMPWEQWHVVVCHASFYIVDSMGVYHRLRMASGQQPSYKLDRVLHAELGLRKLNFEEADGKEAGDWHIFMQERFPIEYCVYNIFDDISVEMLDERTTDLRRIISSQCQHSEYAKFASQTRRTWDDFHFLCDGKNLVEAATSDQMEEELDKHVIGLEGWIATLPSYLVVEEDGLQCLEELPEMYTMIRTHVADLDIVSTYPTLETLANISKETTSRELSVIDGVDEATRRMWGINMSGGHTNSVELTVAMFDAPTFDELLDLFEKEAA